MGKTKKILLAHWFIGVWMIWITRTKRCLKGQILNTKNRITMTTPLLGMATYS